WQHKRHRRERPRALQTFASFIDPIIDARILDVPVGNGKSPCQVFLFRQARKQGLPMRTNMAVTVENLIRLSRTPSIPSEQTRKGLAEDRLACRRRRVCHSRSALCSASKGSESL